MERARRVVVPMDHTKLGIGDFIDLSHLDRIDTIVTDRDNPYLRQMIARHRLQIAFS